MRRAAVRASWLLAGLAAGCGRLDVAEPGPLMIALTAEPAAAATGQAVTFRFEASGNELAKIALDYGDGAVDSIATYLARTAVGDRTHTYASPGAYRAHATVLDNGGQTARDSVDIAIAVPPPVLTSKAFERYLNRAGSGGDRFQLSKSAFGSGRTFILIPVTHAR